MKTTLAFMVICIFVNASAKYILSNHQVDLNTSPKEKPGITSYYLFKLHIALGQVKNFNLIF